MQGGGFPHVTVESRRELRTGSALDGKLPAGNHRQFRCYCCPLEPLRKVCILAVLTEGQRTRVTVSGNRFLAEFRRATEYRMTLRIETPVRPLVSRGVGRWRHALACRSVIFGKPVPAEVCPATSLHESDFRHDSTLFNTVMTDIEDLRQIARVARGLSARPTQLVHWQRADPR